MRKTGTNLPLRRLALTASAAAVTLCAVVPGIAEAKKPKKYKAPAALYTTTNNTTNNELLVFTRKANGALKFKTSVATGGKGGAQTQPGCDPPGGCPFLDASKEVIKTKNGSLIFAVNAGSNTISSFSVKANGKVKLAAQVDSGGVFPTSLARKGNLLYVLNNNSKNIAGFRYTAAGKMTPIAGSVQPLTAEAAPLSRQIGFDNTGAYLVVSHLTDGSFDTFPVKNGVAGPPSSQPSATAFPFSFSFDPINNFMVATEVVNPNDPNQLSNVTSYSLTNTGYTPGSTGGLQKISTVSSQGVAACWTQFTKNGKLLFVVNTGGGAPTGSSVTTFSLSSTGQLTFNSVTPGAGSEFVQTDEFLSPDQKFLYVASPLFNAPTEATNGSRIITYSVGAKGKLTRVGQTSKALAPGITGLIGS
ncbi:MAG: hypothetical protein QOF76_12 [Solirubrobacteraceae bacterium]|nr:hypothetical protein [Solirubrobacteraceae bacterium]